MTPTKLFKCLPCEKRGKETFCDARGAIVKVPWSLRDRVTETSVCQSCLDAEIESVSTKLREPVLSEMTRLGEGKGRV